jgi:hypothetical protein
MSAGLPRDYDKMDCGTSPSLKTGYRRDLITSNFLQIHLQTEASRYTFSCVYLLNSSTIHTSTRRVNKIRKMSMKITYYEIIRK